MKKPGFIEFAIINLVNNIPMAIVMSTAAPLLAGQGIHLPTVALNVVLAFILACVINVVLPIPAIAFGFPKAFKVDPQSLPGRIIGNIPVCLIFVVIIGLILTWFNIRLVPVFIFAFLATFPPLYLICFVISMITNPIAMGLAFGRN